MSPLTAALLVGAAASAATPRELFSLGDRQAASGDSAAALVTYQQAYMQLLPQIRGLSFIQPVTLGVMSRPRLEARLTALMQRELSDEEVQLAERTLTAFGLVDEPVDLKALMLELLTAEIAGFYDSETKQMFLIDVDQTDDELDVEESKAVLSHEMEHALADQHFDLEALHEAARGDDDLSLALAAVVEGEATLMMIIAADGDGADAQEVLQRSPEQVSQLIGLFRRFVPFASGDAFERAPRVIQESLIFPYLEGMIFVLHLTNAAGWKGVDAAFQDPPLSTEHILHPERYRAGDVPQRLEIPELARHLGAGWREVGRNVHGQLQTSIILDLDPRAPAVRGWDGDRYAVFVADRPGQPREGYAWVSTWDTEVDAMEFAAAYVSWLVGRFGSGGPPVRRVEGREGSWLQRGERVSVVQRVGSDVRIVDGLPLDVTDRIMRALARTKRQDKVLRHGKPR